MKTTLYPNWQDKVIFAHDGPKPQKLIETEAFKTVLVGLEPLDTQLPSDATLKHLLD